ncbi:hypothetical protein [Paenibacillus jiagnxiensis]|uniref:hypothetical protein n=1 Tax=Paenibacillus jiagnxiensis TaxID=3228926 RepID=UPI0033A0E9B0
MRYFRLMADERVQHRVEPSSLSRLQVEEVMSVTRSPETQETSLFLSVYTDQRTVYPDFLEYPLPLVSDRVKGLLEKYMPELAWKAAILTDFEQARQEAYWVLRPPVMDCLSNQSERYPDQTLKQLVLRQVEGMPPVLRIGGLLEPYIYIHLSVAESLLRRSLTGIRVERIEMEAREG